MAAEGASAPTQQMGDVESEALLNFAERLLRDRDLQCLAQCGFYGSPEYGGYCSQCAKKVAATQVRSTPTHPQPAPAATEELPTTSADVASTLVAAASAASLSKWFKRVGVGLGLASGEQESDGGATGEPARFDFNAVMRQPAVADIVLATRQFVRWFNDRTDLTASEQSQRVQDFLHDIEQRVRQHPALRNLPADHITAIIDGLERRVCSKVYRAAFSPNGEAERDVKLRNRIRELQWIGLARLMSDPTAMPDSPQSAECFAEARAELQLLSSKRAPADKLQLVVNCCHAIFRACTSPIGADEFLPLLIYVVIGANPARLYSNLQYISRYCNPSRLMAGEGGYFFTNLCCAVAFIEGLDYHSLGMTQEDFERQVKLQRLLIEYPPFPAQPLDYWQPLKQAQAAADAAGTQPGGLDVLEALGSVLVSLREGQAQLFSAMRNMDSASPGAPVCQPASRPPTGEGDAMEATAVVSLPEPEAAATAGAALFGSAASLLTLSSPVPDAERETAAVSVAEEADAPVAVLEDLVPEQQQAADSHSTAGAVSTEPLHEAVADNTLPQAVSQTDALPDSSVAIFSGEHTGPPAEEADASSVQDGLHADGLAPFESVLSLTEASAATNEAPSPAPPPEGHAGQQHSLDLSVPVESEREAQQPVEVLAQTPLAHDGDSTGAAPADAETTTAAHMGEPAPGLAGWDDTEPGVVGTPEPDSGAAHQSGKSLAAVSGTVVPDESAAADIQHSSETAPWEDAGQSGLDALPTVSALSPSEHTADSAPAEEPTVESSADAHAEAQDAFGPGVQGGDAEPTGALSPPPSPSELMADTRLPREVPVVDLTDSHGDISTPPTAGPIAPGHEHESPTFSSDQAHAPGSPIGVGEENTDSPPAPQQAVEGGSLLLDMDVDPEHTSTPGSVSGRGQEPADTVMSEDTAELVLDTDACAAEGALHPGVEAAVETEALPGAGWATPDPQDPAAMAPPAEPATETIRSEQVLLLVDESPSKGDDHALDPAPSGSVPTSNDGGSGSLHGGPTPPLSEPSDELVPATTGVSGQLSDSPLADDRSSAPVPDGSGSSALAADAVLPPSVPSPIPHDSSADTAPAHSGGQEREITAARSLTPSVSVPRSPPSSAGSQQRANNNRPQQPSAQWDMYARPLTKPRPPSPKDTQLLSALNPFGANNSNAQLGPTPNTTAAQQTEAASVGAGHTTPADAGEDLAALNSAPGLAGAGAASAVDEVEEEDEWGGFVGVHHDSPPCEEAPSQGAVAVDAVVAGEEEETHDRGGWSDFANSAASAGEQRPPSPPLAAAPAQASTPSQTGVGDAEEEWDWGGYEEPAGVASAAVLSDGMDEFGSWGETDTSLALVADLGLGRPHVSDVSVPVSSIEVSAPAHGQDASGGGVDDDTFGEWGGFVGSVENVYAESVKESEDSSKEPASDLLIDFA